MPAAGQVTDCVLVKMEPTPLATCISAMEVMKDGRRRYATKYPPTQPNNAPTATLMDEDGAAGRAYAARVTPHMYIVDAQGRLLYAGAIDSIPSGRTEDIRSATNYVRQGLAEALAGKPLSQPSTRPYGCTIKYR